MYIQDVIGKILYIGIVAEKGRCYGRKWEKGYKECLRKHILALNDLQKCLLIANEEVVYHRLENFFEICKQNYEIGKFYDFSHMQVEEISIGEGKDNINLLMELLFNDLIKEVQKKFIRKKRIYNYLCALHNLPRVYLGKDKQTLCHIGQESITEQEAIEYAFGNMNIEMITKYQAYINLDI